ncbi:Ig-like domain-containing protein [Pantoea sp. GbtcB22]|uniref:Ig-like domain-containing protein n=1 Tax=Pantoea sp. GbtcB22 TaxID=2824767 RepID=UPI001C2FD96D|nr:Ig-like domain-containing protein [Pantoea sp. GbtcB22]
MSTPINVIIVEGKNITGSAELAQAANGAPVRMKAVKGAKFLFTSGKDGAVNEHIIVKRTGKNLQVFLDNNDDQPALIIEDYYGNQAELAGMGSDGQYHTFITEGTDSQAFMMLEDGAATPLLMSSSATDGLSGLSLASAAAGGMSMGWMIAGAIGGLLALGGVAAAAGGGGGGKGGDDNPPEPAPAPAPVDMNSFTLTDGVGSVGGPVSAGGTTDDARPVMAGCGTPGNVVRIYDNGQLIGSTVIDDSGRWQWQPESNLAAGQHDLSFSEVNHDGVEGERSPGFGFELDLTAPARVSDLVIADGVGASQGAIAAGDTINDRSPIFSGKAEAGATVEIRDNGELIGSALVGADGSWSFTPSPALANGEHNFTVIVVDPAGNAGLPVGLGPVIIDDTLVDVPAFGELTDGNGNPLQPGGAYNTNPMHMGGNGNPGDIVTIIRNGQPAGSAVVGDNGEWQFELVIPETDQGEQVIGLIVTAPSGEELGRSEDFSFEFDTTPPATPSMDDVSVTDGSGNPLTADDVTNVSDLVFSGSAEEGDLVKLYDGDKLIGSALVGADGSWSIPVSDLEGGSHDFRTEITDPAGNVSEKSDGFGLEVDFTPPAQTSADVTDAAGNPVASGSAVNGDLTFRGTGEPGDTVYLRDGGNLVGTAVIDASGNWSLVANMTEERDYAFQTEVKDPAGNSSGLSEAIEFNFDITKPTTPIAPGVGLQDGSAITDPAINQSDIRLNGQTEAHATVIIYDGSTPIGSVTADENGAWSFDYTLTQEREYTFRSEAVDSAGNVSDRSDSTTISYDVTPPDTVSIIGVEKNNGDAISDGGYSNDKNPLFRGTGAHGDLVYLVDDISGQTLGSALVDENGNWSITPDAALDDGALTLRIDVKDPAGNTATGTDTFALNVDSQAPDAAKNITLEGPVPTLSGPDGSVEAHAVVLIMDGTTQIGSAQADENGKWTWKSDSAPVSGDRTFSVVVQDAAGNLSENNPSFGLETNVTDFTNDDMDGWVLRDHATNTKFKVPGQLLIDTPTTLVDQSGDFLWKDIIVKAGETYHFSFDVYNAQNLANGILGVNFNGDNVIPPTSLDTIGQWITLSGSWTATVDGSVRITMFNNQSENWGNDFSLDNLVLSHEYTPAADPVFIYDQGSLSINLDEQHLDFSQLSVDADEINHVALEGHGNNTLTLSLGDVLSLGGDDLFLNDGASQMMITGDAGDVVNLSDLLPDGTDTGNWNIAGDVIVGGVTYQVYQHSGLDADLLVQQNVTVNLDNH